MKSLQPFVDIVLYLDDKSRKSHKFVQLNTLGTGDTDLRFYRVLQSFVSFVTI
jgi:hypothetical protein